MKGVTIILTGLMLMLGLATASAATGPYTGSNFAALADHADLALHDPVGDAILPLETDPQFAALGDEEIAASQPMTVWDYAISPQITFDLEYRPVATTENGSSLITDNGSIVDFDYLTQNLMVGVRYNFNF